MISNTPPWYFPDSKTDMELRQLFIIKKDNPEIIKSYAHEIMDNFKIFTDRSKTEQAKSDRPTIYPK